jgi:hypothetical protein
MSKICHFLFLGAITESICQLVMQFGYVFSLLLNLFFLREKKYIDLSISPFIHSMDQLKFRFWIMGCMLQVSGFIRPSIHSIFFSVPPVKVDIY